MVPIGRPARRALIFGVALVTAALAVAPTPAEGVGGWVWDKRFKVADGVEHRKLRRGSPSPLYVNIARLAPDAKVRLRPILAHGAIGDYSPSKARETTSDMCRRVGAVACINADFMACPICRQPFGGVVVNGRTVRSFYPGHEQFSKVKSGKYTTERLRWRGRLRATYEWEEEVSETIESDTGTSVSEGVAPRKVTREVPLAGINIDVPMDGAVLYTSEWGARTPLGNRIELTLASDASVRNGAMAVRFNGERQTSGPIPKTGAVVTGVGSGGLALAQFLNEWRTIKAEKTLVLDTGVKPAVRQSVGGHPVLLRNGRRAAMNYADPKVVYRHPRTLAGWTPGGSLLLVTVDGRQPGHSVGTTLPESAALLRELGAASGINLDGGGSTTFVGRCAGGPCVQNRPSDGRERPVAVGLAVIPDVPPPAMKTPPPPPPPPARPRKKPPGPDPASTPVFKPAKEAPTTTVATTTTTEARVERALPVTSPRRPRPPAPQDSPSYLPFMIGAAALLATTGSAVAWRRRVVARRKGGSGPPPPPRDRWPHVGFRPA